MKKSLLALCLLMVASISVAEVKTLTCMTNDMSPNVDIRVETGRENAVVKLIMFGNDVDQAPTDGLSQVVSLEEAKNLLAGNGILAFYNDANDKLVVILKDGNGTIAISSGENVQIVQIDNCR
jgi:hypothetical protein